MLYIDFLKIEAYHFFTDHRPLYVLSSLEFGKKGGELKGESIRGGELKLMFGQTKVEDNFMGKLISGLIAVVAILVVTQSAKAQDTGGCTDINSKACCVQFCVNESHGGEGGFSVNECIRDLCGSGSVSKISQGYIWQGGVYTSLSDVAEACVSFVSTIGNETLGCYYRTFTDLTGNPDSGFVFPGINIDINGDGTLDSPCDNNSPTIAAVSVPDNTECHSIVSCPGCTTSKDKLFTNPITLTTSPGLGCRETNPTLWTSQGCPSNCGCCTTSSSTWNGTNCLVAGTRGDGVY
jgi:hypothetical protein